MPRLRDVAAGVLGLPALLLAPALCLPALADVTAAVTIKPVHALVARVMEGVSTPSVLVAGAASPHSYALKPSDAKMLNAVDVFFRVGEAIEPFTARIVPALPASVTVVTLAEAPGIMLLARREGGTWEAHRHDEDEGGESHEDHGKGGGERHGDGSRAHETAGREEPGGHGHAHEHGENGSGRDHHIWLDPANARAMVAEIARVLAAKSPAHAAKFRENAARLTADLDALAAELHRDLAPLRGKPFIVFHDAYQYFERRFGLRAAGSITVSPDVPPSARRLSEIRQKILKLGAVCVFAEPQFQPSLVAAVTEGTKARSGTLDPEGMDIPPGPDAYFQLMRALAANLKSCLDPAA